MRHWIRLSVVAALPPAFSDDFDYKEKVQHHGAGTCRKCVPHREDKRWRLFKEIKAL